jgi:hypothetical protein
MNFAMLKMMEAVRVDRFGSGVRSEETRVVALGDSADLVTYSLEGEAMVLSLYSRLSGVRLLSHKVDI